MGDEQRRSSPPPTYEEAMNDRPPPPYSENQIPGSTHTHHGELNAPTQRNTRVSPITTSPANVIVNQPGRRNDGIVSGEAGNRVTQPQKKRLGCNCFCTALQCTPCTCDCELFCFNCLGFVSYLLLCAPGVYMCWGCKKMCPETYGECYTRRTSFMDSYDEREDSVAARVCWFCFGPCCCFTCAGDTEVCSCTDPCVKHFGFRAVLKKMTCYCGSYKLCDYNLNIMDEQALGFICDCKEVGCLCRDTSG